MKETVTPIIGNTDAGGLTVVDLHDPTTEIATLDVRWNGDRISGLQWTYRNGVVQHAGNNTNENLSSYYFQPHEYLQTLNLAQSGWGYTSFRRIHFTTILPAKGPGGLPVEGPGFTAGPEGVDHQISPIVHGLYMCGFKVWVNQDVFINAVAVYCTDTYSAVSAARSAAVHRPAL